MKREDSLENRVQKKGRMQGNRERLINVFKQKKKKNFNIRLTYINLIFVYLLTD